MFAGTVPFHFGIINLCLTFMNIKVAKLEQGNNIVLENANLARTVEVFNFPFNGHPDFPGISIERSVDPVADFGNAWKKSFVVDVG